MGIIERATTRIRGAGVLRAAPLLAGIALFLGRVPPFVPSLWAVEPAGTPEGEEGPPAAVAAGDDERWQHLALVSDEFARVLRAELAFLRAAHGDLPTEARRAIREAGEHAVAAAAERHVDAIDVYTIAAETSAAEIDFAGRAVSPEAIRLIDPRTEIREALAAALGEQVGPERARERIDGFAWREATRRRAIVRRILLRLDGEFHLSGAQWDAVEKDLLAAWDERLCASATSSEGLVGIDLRWTSPGLLYDLVLPHLEPAQRALLGPRSDRERERGAIAEWLQDLRFGLNPAGVAESEDGWWHE